MGSAASSLDDNNSGPTTDRRAAATRRRGASDDVQVDARRVRQRPDATIRQSSLVNDSMLLWLL
jgi:hypothetical protein